MVFECLLDLVAYLVESTFVLNSCLAEWHVVLPLNFDVIADISSLSLTPMKRDTMVPLSVLTCGDVCSPGFDHSMQKFRDVMMVSSFPMHSGRRGLRWLRSSLVTCRAGWKMLPADAFWTAMMYRRHSI